MQKQTLIIVLMMTMMSLVVAQPITLDHLEIEKPSESFFNSTSEIIFKTYDLNNKLVEATEIIISSSPTLNNEIKIRMRESGSYSIIVPVENEQQINLSLTVNQLGKELQESITLNIIEEKNKIFQNKDETIQILKNNWGYIFTGFFLIILLILLIKFTE